MSQDFDSSKQNNTVRVRMDLGYDGTNFSGWAKQPQQRTVQGELERALATLLRVTHVALTVAGRTDAGVHARGQVCSFDVSDVLLEKLSGRGSLRDSELSARRVNGVLARFNAPDIEVHTLKVVPDTFDARFSALARKYEYRLAQNAVRKDPLTRNFTVSLKENLDLKLMSEFSHNLVGLRDFGTFCKPRDGATTIRELQVFDWFEGEDGIFVATLKADAFCHSMVRSLIGAAVAVGSSRLSVSEAMKLTEAKKRCSQFKMMPPQGLSLQKVYYPQEHNYGARAEATRAKRSDAA
ncbi:MAG TPA: tRNA pseudouridine(38-40) synthase TruA [Microbacteriaceae bacterium]|nr:tRNA pseudouridine(38-40) synthase TruA [Microbacteriaceae bacterium]